MQSAQSQVISPAQQYAINTELDVLLAGTNSRKAEPQAEVFSLDSLLEESMAARKDAVSVKAARSLLSGPAKVEPEARKAMEESIRAWEAKREWDTKAGVAAYTRQFCETCDCYHTTFSGFFHRQAHRNSKVSRWVRCEKEQMLALPKEVKYEDEICPMCEDCAKAAGFPVED